MKETHYNTGAGEKDHICDLVSKVYIHIYEL